MKTFKELLFKSLHLIYVQLIKVMKIYIFMFVYTLQQRVLLLIILPMFKLLVLKLVKIIIVFLNTKLLIVSIVLDKEMLKQFFCSSMKQLVFYIN